MSIHIDMVDEYAKWCEEHKDEIAIDVDLHPEHNAAYKEFCKILKIPYALVGLEASIYPEDVETNET